MAANVLHWVLLVVTWICWVLGVVLPIVELTPFPVLQNQDLPNFVGYGHMFEVTHKSTWETLHLLHDKQYLVAFSILLTCSVIVPFLKLFTASVVLLHSSFKHPQVITVLANLSSYQLVNLFLGILFIGFCNTEAFAAHLRIGFVCFGAYCLLSQALMLALENEINPVVGLGPEEEDVENLGLDGTLLSSHGGGSRGHMDSLDSMESTMTSTATSKARKSRMLEVDVYTSLMNSLAVGGLAFYGASQPMLDTAITFNGIALSRTTLGLQDIAVRVSHETGTLVCVAMALSVVGVPLLVAALALTGEALRRYGDTGRKGLSQNLLHLARALAPWITADVFSLSMITFLFSVQGEHLHTTIPDGTLLGITSDWFSGFYVGLGIGAAGFSLKFKAVHWPKEDDFDDLLLTEEQYLARRRMSIADTSMLTVEPGGTMTTDFSTGGSSQMGFTDQGPQYAVVPMMEQDDSSEQETSSPAQRQGRPASPPARLPSVSSPPSASASVQHGRKGPSVRFSSDDSPPSGCAAAKHGRSSHTGDEPVPMAMGGSAGDAPPAPAGLRRDGSATDLHLGSAANVEDGSAPAASSSSSAAQQQPVDDSSIVRTTTEAAESVAEGRGFVEEAAGPAKGAESGASGTASKDAQVDGVAGEVGNDSVPEGLGSEKGSATEVDGGVAKEAFEAGPARLDEEDEVATGVDGDGCTEGPAFASAPPGVQTGAADVAEPPVEGQPADVASQDDARPTAEPSADGAPSDASADVSFATTSASETLSFLVPAVVEPVVVEPVESPSKRGLLGPRGFGIWEAVTSKRSNNSREDEAATEAEAASAAAAGAAASSEQHATGSSTDAAVLAEPPAAEPVESQGAEAGRDEEVPPAGAARELQAEADHSAPPPLLTAAPPSNSHAAQQMPSAGQQAKNKSFMGKLIRNPVFHVKATVWIIWAICFFFVKGPEEFTYMKLNHALEGVLPLLNNAMGQNLPRSIGDCGSNASSLAPPPCVSAGALYNSTKEGWGIGPAQEKQRVLARWVTGVNTVHLKSVSLHVIPDSPKPIQVSIRGQVLDLKMSIRIEQCWLQYCKALWDSTDGCCKPHRQFEIIIATDCGDHAGQATLGEFAVEYFNIDDVVLSEDVLGLFHEKLADLTPRVKATVKNLTAKVFQGDTMFLNHTFSEVLSTLWRYNTARGMSCSDFLKDME